MRTGLPALGVGSMLRMARNPPTEHPVSAAEESCMRRSPRLTRRGLLAAAAAVAALKLSPARAQTTTAPNCSLGFVNGPLQFDLECPLLDPHGTVIGELDYEVAPPHHLVMLVAATDGATGTATETTRIPQSGSRRKRKKARVRKRRKRTNSSGKTTTTP